MNSIGKLLEYWQATFFLEVFIIICQCVAITTCILYYKKESTRFIFLLYSIISLLLFSYTPIAILLSFPKETFQTWDLLLNLLFELTEFFCFFYLFIQIVHSKTVKIL